ILFGTRGPPRRRSSTTCLKRMLEGSGPRGPAEIARLLTEDFIMMKTNTQLLQVSRWQPFSWSPLREFQEDMMLVRERFAAGNHPALASTYPPLNIWGDSDNVY